MIDSIKCFGKIQKTPIVRFPWSKASEILECRSENGTYVEWFCRKPNLFSLMAENFSRNEIVLLNMVFSKNLENYGRTDIGLQFKLFSL